MRRRMTTGAHFSLFDVEILYIDEVSSGTLHRLSLSRPPSHP
jgi:hypothetical protein